MSSIFYHSHAMAVFLNFVIDRGEADCCKEEKDLSGDFFLLS